MTHHTLSSFKDQLLIRQDDCTFCQIVAGKQDAFKVYEDEHTLAFLDILPLRKGHTLVIPRSHVSQLSTLSPLQASQVAQSLVLISRGLSKALGDERMQVITNQVYGQVVPHVHFHLVPAPTFSDSSTSTSKSQNGSSKPTPKANPMLLIGHGRDELDDEEGKVLCEQIKKGVEEERKSWSEELRNDQEKEISTRSKL